MGKLIYLFKEENQMCDRISIKDVAKTFLSFQSMTHKKLQKLCFYAQALHLAINKEPLVYDIEFQAWVHGPVCNDLYQEYKHKGATPIRKTDLPKNILKDSYEYYFIKGIFDKYGHLSGNELEKLTHTEAPWLNARRRDNVHYWQPSTEPILEDDMMNYYSKEI